MRPALVNSKPQHGRSLSAEAVGTTRSSGSLDHLTTIERPEIASALLAASQLTKPDEQVIRLTKA